MKRLEARRLTAAGLWNGSVRLFVLLLLATAGCQRQPLDEQLPLAVQVATVALQTFSSEMRYTATVKELQKVDLSFKVAGTVQQLHQITDPTTQQPRDVQVGDQVQPGTMLAKLDEGDYRRKYNGAREQVAKAESQRVAAQADADLAAKDLKRSQDLFAKGVETREQLDAAERRQTSTRAAVAIADREVEGARIEEQQAKDDLDNCTLATPSMESAVVAEKFVEKSERVAAAQDAFVLIDVSKVRAAFGVPDQLVGNLQIGQSLAVVAEALGGQKFAGRVSKIAPAADLRTRSFLVEVTIDEPGRLKPGMIVTTTIGEQRQGLLLPMTAVQRGRDGSRFVVFKVERDKDRSVVRECRVELGGVYDNRIQVKSGAETELRAGDAIVAVGAWRLSSGQAVRVVQEEAKP